MTLNDVLKMLIEPNTQSTSVTDALSQAMSNYTNSLNRITNTDELKAVLEDWDVMLTIPIPCGIETYKRLFQIQTTSAELRLLASYLYIYVRSRLG